MPELDLDLNREIVGFAVALGLGLLIGAEREQRKDDDANGSAGVRTFTLIALAGAIAQHLGEIAIGVAGAFVAFAAIASYVRPRQANPGLTTEVAMLVVYMLGVLAMTQAVLAAALGVVVGLVLASKSRLHSFTQEVLTAQELRDAMLLAGAALIVLPLLPEGAVDPWGAIDLRKVWRLVVLVMAIQAIGYIGLRVLGARYGLVVTGFTGGFVSSTATIGSMGLRARSAPKLEASAVAAALVSNVATVIQLALVLAAISMPMLQRLAPSLVAAGLAAALATVVLGWSGLRASGEDQDVVRGRPFEPLHAIAFAAIVATILLLAAVVQHWLGERGVMVAGALAGFADAHASSGSVAQMVANGRAPMDLGAWAVFAAFATNTTSKIAAAFGAGGARFGTRLLPGLLFMVAAFAAPLLFLEAPAGEDAPA